jgi:hypothetical protein
MYTDVKAKGESSAGVVESRFRTPLHINTLPKRDIASMKSRSRLVDQIKTIKTNRNGSTVVMRNPPRKRLLESNARPEHRWRIGESWEDISLIPLDYLEMVQFSSIEKDRLDWSGKLEVDD